MPSSTINPSTFNFNNLTSLKNNIPEAHEVRGRGSHVPFSKDIVLYSKEKVKDSSITSEHTTSQSWGSTSFSDRQASYDKGRTELKAALLHLCESSRFKGKESQIESLFNDIALRTRGDGHTGVLKGSDIKAAYNRLTQPLPSKVKVPKQSLLQMSHSQLSPVNLTKKQETQPLSSSLSSPIVRPQVKLSTQVESSSTLSSHVLSQEELLGERALDCQKAKEVLESHVPNLKRCDIKIVNPDLGKGVCHNYALHNEFRNDEINEVNSHVPGEGSLHRDYLELLKRDPEARVAVFYQGGTVGHTARFDKDLQEFVHTLPGEALFTCPIEQFKRSGGYSKLEVLTPDMKSQFEHEIRELDLQEQKRVQSLQLKDSQVGELLKLKLDYLGVDDMCLTMSLEEATSEFSLDTDGQKIFQLYQEIEFENKAGKAKVQYLTEQISKQHINFDVNKFMQENSAYF